MNIAELAAANHPYSCSTINYYSNYATRHYSTWEDFYYEFKGADVDMNLVFRWDVIQVDEDERLEIGNHIGYKMEVFIMGQRKGIFMPQVIDNVSDKDVEEIVSYLTPHIERLKQMWYPFN